MNAAPQDLKEPNLEWLGSIPNDWSVKRIKDIADLKSGDAIASEEITPAGEYPVFGGNGVRGFTTLPTHDGHYVLIGRQGALCGNINYAKGKFWATEHAVVATLAKNHEPMWFGELLRTMNLNQYSNAAAQPGLAVDRIKVLRLPVPPLPEQHRIAAYLNASCAAIDAAVAAKRRQLETLDAVRKSTVVHVVTKGLVAGVVQRESDVDWFRKIPKHWKCEHLKRFAARIQTGVTPPTDTPDYYFDGTIPWFAPGSYDGDIELREPQKLISELALREGVLRMFPAESVFLIGIGATIGKVGIIIEPASCNQQIIGIVCNHRLLGRYLAYQMKIYEDVIPGVAVATTLPIFDQVKTGYLPILVPPRKEQEAICDFLDAKLNDVKNVVATINQQIITLTAYRKSLIHECVTGQRRITEADINRVKARG